MSSEMTLEEVLQNILDNRADGIHTALPGEVISYNAAKQTAVIRPLLLERVPGRREETEDEYEILPAIPNVPILHLRGSSFYIHFPLQAGDSVLLLFLEADPSQWRASGSLSKPADQRTHSLAHAVAIPGLASSLSALADASSGAMTFGLDGGPKFEIGLTLMRAFNGTEPFVRGTAFASALNTFLTATSTLSVAHGVAWAAIGTFLPPAAAAMATAASAEVAYQTALVAFAAALIPGNVLSLKFFGD